MSIQQTFDQQQVSKPTSEKRERDIIFTANGSARASEIVHRTGALVGMESLNTRPPDDIPINFVDWPFSKLKKFPDVGELFDQHLEIVKSEQPRIAVAPDIDDRVPYDDAVSMAEELNDYADTVVLVPKTVLPTDVPTGYRVGMPCQERYGPTPWKWTQYRPCEEVHLLGGSPVKHHEILKYSVPVESVDTSVPVTSAGWGDYWNGAKWVNADSQDEFFYPCLRRSYSNMRYSMNERRDVWCPRSRNRRLDHEPENPDLWDENDTEPSPAYQLRG